VKQYVRIYLLGLIALFFISTTGITVYKHYCSHGGEFYGVFIDVSHDCEPEEDVEKAHACCTTGSGDADFEFTFTEECCTSDVDFYQIDSDLIQQNVEVDFVKVFTSSHTFEVTLSFPKYKKVIASNKAPPVLSTNERLSLFQMYLI